MSETNGSRAGFDPRVPYDLWLDCFDKCDDAQRPTFKFRRLNGAEFNEVGKAIYDSAPTDTQQFSDSVFAAFKTGLIGWRHQIDPATEQEVPFELAHVEQVINAQEAFNLCQKRIERGRLSGADLKNSVAQS